MNGWLFELLKNNKVNRISKLWNKYSKIANP